MGNQCSSNEAPIKLIPLTRASEKAHLAEVGHQWGGLPSALELPMLARRDRFLLARCLAVVGAMAIEGGVLRAQSPTVWNGSTGVWSNAAGWSGGLVPDAGTDAQVNAGTVTLDGVYSIHNLSLNGTGKIVGLRNGSFQIAGSATLAGPSIAGGGLLSAPFEDGCVFSLNGGGMMSGGGLTLTGVVLAVPVGQTLEHSPGAGSININSNSAIRNNGTLLIRSSGGFSGGLAGEIVNSGEIRSDTGPGISVINVPVTNSGPINILSGTLGLNSAGIGTASVNIASGATLNIGYYSFSQSAIVRGPGTLTVSGTLRLNDSVQFDATLFTLIIGIVAHTSDNTVSYGTTEFRAGELSGSFGMYRNAGTMMITGANVKLITGKLQNDASGLLIDRSTSNSLEFYNGGRFTNNGTYIADGPGGMARNGGFQSPFQNIGLFRIKAGSGTYSTAFGILIDNQGTIRVETGTLSIGYPVAQYDSASQSLTGGTWEIQNAASLAGGIGNVKINGATIRLSGPTSIFASANAMTTNLNFFSISEGRNFTTTGAFSNQGVLEIGSGSTFLCSGPLTVTAPASVTIGGTLNAGNLTNAGLIEIGSSGVLSLTGNVTNDGLIRALGGGSIASSAATSFVNNGTIDVITGTFLRPPGFVNNGVILDSSLVKVRQTVKEGTVVTIAIDAYTGHTFQLRRSTTLDGGGFVNIGVSQTGNTGSTLTFSDQNATTADCFYQIVVGP